jgi:drug/metabolite transporter (DMT)-like permease
MTTPTSRLVLLAISVTVVLWASAFIGIRMAGSHLAPGPLALGRMLTGLATLSVVVVVRARRGRPLRLPRGRTLLGALAWGIAWFGLYNLALNAAERRVDAGTTALLVNAAPILIAVLGGVLLGEGFPRRLLLGLGIAFLGVALIAATTGTGGGDAAGVLLALAAAVLYALAATSQKVLLEHVDPLTLTWVGAFAGTVVLVPYAPQLVTELAAAPVGSVVAVAYLGVFPTGIAFLTWGYALARTTAGQLAVTTYASPAVVVLLSWLLLAEVPSALALAGGVTCLLGVAVATGRSRRPRAHHAGLRTSGSAGRVDEAPLPPRTAGGAADESPSRR